MDRIPVLGEDGQDVALGELEREPADVDVGGVAVIGVPAAVGGDHFLELGFVEAGDLANGLHGDGVATVSESERKEEEREEALDIFGRDSRSSSSRSFPRKS